MFLDALRADRQRARPQVFDDLRNIKDPEATTTSPKRRRTARSRRTIAATAWLTPARQESLRQGLKPPAERRYMSNALLGAKRSATGRPVFVAGPQLGYYYPEIVDEVDLHGGGIGARGITSPGAGPYVFIGRGEDFSGASPRRATTSSTPTSRPSAGAATRSTCTRASAAT